jgi:MFS family permease
MVGREWSAKRAFRGLCAAVVISEIGDWLLFIALPLYVLHASGSPLETSGVFLAELIPTVLVGITCGPLIDRRDPSRLLSGLTAAQALVVVPLLWAEPGEVWLVCAVAALQAALTSLTLPAQQAVVPRIVDTPALARANAILETASNVARLVGSPLGGALLPIVGLHGLVLGDIGSFAISAVLLSHLPTTPVRLAERAASSSGGLFTAVLEGAQAVRRSCTLGAALIISFVSAVAQGLFLVLFVLFVLRSLHAGDELVGLLRGVQAIGGVLGGVLVAGRLRHSSPRVLAIWGLTAFTCISAFCWNSPHLTTSAWWYVILFTFVGIPATMLTAGLITGIQQASRSDLRGRILSLLAVADAVGQASGILAAGLLSSLTSLALLLDVQAGCYLTCALVALAFFGRSPRRRSPQPATAQSTPRATTGGS